MRLINTSTLEQEEFFEAPPYAILSHRWGNQEVSYEDYALLHDATLEPMRELLKARVLQTEKKSGYRKIIDCCEYTRRQGHSYVWIDTCCIDKRSSAELSESINSMYRWYKNSETCYIHLADVLSSIALPNDLYEAFDASSWFKRCWTLQELLAPGRLVFLCSNWTPIFDLGKWIGDCPRPKLTDTQQTWLRRLINITSIPEEFLLRPNIIDFPPGNIGPSIAQRMSWAARREATREEDIAYSLMGLFDVNMPLIYGEGTKAFRRLQIEIIQRQSDDESILAWRNPDGRLRQIDGFLAPDPSVFASCGNVYHRDSSLGTWLPVIPTTITPRGVQIGTECSGTHWSGTPRMATRLFQHKSRAVARLQLTCGEGEYYDIENKRCTLEFIRIPNVGDTARTRQNTSGFALPMTHVDWEAQPHIKQIWLEINEFDLNATHLIEARKG